MAILQNTIEFSSLVEVCMANPNGEPTAENRPFTAPGGFGVIKPPCIRHKLRNRFQLMGQPILEQEYRRRDDEFETTEARAQHGIPFYTDRQDHSRQACEKWLDVRTFGTVLKHNAQHGEMCDDSARATGPFCLFGDAKSVSPVNITEETIIKCVPGEDGKAKGHHDTMGSISLVEYGIYRINGFLSPNMAEATGFTEDDAEVVKEALCTLFSNDGSKARPRGSVNVLCVLWWKHATKDGYDYNRFQVFDSFQVTRRYKGPRMDIYPFCVDDYDYRLEKLPGLEPEILLGHN